MSKAIDEMSKDDFIKHLDRSVVEGCYKGKDLLESIGMPNKSIGEVLSISPYIRNYVTYRADVYEKEEARIASSGDDDSDSCKKRLAIFKEDVWKNVMETFQRKIRELTAFLFVEEGRRKYFFEGAVEELREHFFKHDRVDTDLDPK